MPSVHSTISLSKSELLPAPELFAQRSELHGRLHVGRVMVLGFLLIDATQSYDLEIPLWAAIYVHDLAREHDGLCQDHGEWAIEKLRRTPEIRDLLKRACFSPKHSRMLDTAVSHHCRMLELEPDHAHYRLTTLLKDADGLDRVRLDDLDPAYLRHPEAHDLISTAEILYAQTHGHLDQDDPNLMGQLWKMVSHL
jgi:uncharacterized protein